MATRKARMPALTREYVEVMTKLQAEKKRGEQLKRELKEMQAQCGDGLLSKSIEEMSIEELLNFKVVLELFLEDIHARQAEIKASGFAKKTETM